MNETQGVVMSSGSKFQTIVSPVEQVMNGR